MSFQLLEGNRGNFSSLVLKERNSNSELTIIPDLGAAIFDLKLEKNSFCYSIIQSPPDDNSLLESYLLGFQGANLLPFPNRIKNGRFQFNNVEYQLNKNGSEGLHAIHGLVYDKSFAIKEFQPKFGILDLEYMERDTQSGYPFRFKQNIEFRLTSNSLSITVTIENLESINIPIAQGWHPYLSFGTGINNLQLKIAGQNYFQLGINNIPNGKINYLGKYVNLEEIKETSLDHCFAIDQKIGVSELYDPVSDVKISYFQEGGENGYKFVQYYTPLDRNSIAIEPMSSMPDAFNQDISNCLLAPREKLILKSWIKLT